MRETCRSKRVPLLFGVLLFLALFSGRSAESQAAPPPDDKCATPVAYTKPINIKSDKGELENDPEKCVIVHVATDKIIKWHSNGNTKKAQIVFQANPNSPCVEDISTADPNTDKDGICTLTTQAILDASKKTHYIYVIVGAEDTNKDPTIIVQN